MARDALAAVDREIEAMSNGTRDWKRWAEEYLSALGDNDQDECEALQAELDATLDTGPLHLGIRTDADIANVANAAARADDSTAALAVLRKRLTVRMMASSDLLAAGELPEREWIVADGWLPAGRAGLLAGRGGAGKSRLGLQLACAVAAGARRWLGRDEKYLHSEGIGDAVGPVGCAPSPVVFASWEDELSDTMRRCRDMEHALHWLTPEAIRNRVHWIDASPHGPLWGPSEDGSRHVATMAGLTPVGRAIRAFCECVRARLLVLDPLAAVYASDENARGLVRHFMTSWDAWARKIGCAVMLIAHPPKSAAAFSGSTDWENASRWMWTLVYQPTGWYTAADGTISMKKNKDSAPITAPRLDLAKTNYGQRGRRIWLRTPSPSWAAWEQCTSGEAKDAVLDMLAQRPSNEDEEPLF